MLIPLQISRNLPLAILGSVPGAFRVPCKLGGLDLHVIGKDELIQNKLASGRLQDLADVERLRQGS